MHESNYELNYQSKEFDSFHRIEKILLLFWKKNEKLVRIILASISVAINKANRTIEELHQKQRYKVVH